MNTGDLLKLFKDYFEYGIPLGVVLVIIITVIIIFGFMFKYIKSGFEVQIQESRKDFGMLIKQYRETINQQNKRITSLEHRLDNNKCKGGKGK
ncbi:hypothetical protein [Gemella morbillorum]